MNLPIVKNGFFDFETKFFPLFYLRCKYRFKYYKEEDIINFCLEVDKEKDFSRRLHGLNVAMSSGTSGNKGVEIVTPEEENYLKAALSSRFDLPKGEKVNLAFILRVSAPAFNLNKFGHKLTYISQLNLIEEINKKLYE